MKNFKNWGERDHGPPISPQAPPLSIIVFVTYFKNMKEKIKLI